MPRGRKCRLRKHYSRSIVTARETAYYRTRRQWECKLASPFIHFSGLREGLGLG
jgi:hypothetical protein